MVGDLINRAENGNTEISDKKKYNIKDFPKSKTDKDKRFLKSSFKKVYSIYKFSVSGAENIPESGNYILCPNHESYFDAVFVAAALNKANHRTDNICCLAAEHLFDKSFMKKGVAALGGIPVDRSGNTAPAIERALECLKNDDCVMLIHPEGTRTRTGKLGEFKQGAAKLAIDSGVKIIPVCISGANEIYPPDRKTPRLFNFKRLGKYPLSISFGKAIEPASKTAEAITEEIRTNIINVKEGR